jgi:hypothetical protein
LVVERDPTASSWRLGWAKLDRIASDPRHLRRQADRSTHADFRRADSEFAGQGESQEDILADYPGLQPMDIRACVAYAHAVLDNERLDDAVVTHG